MYWDQLFTQHDTYFIGPIFCVAMNYALIQASRHPWLVNVREGWSDTAKWATSLYAAAPFIVMPQSMTVAWLSYGTVHLLMNRLFKQ